MSKRLLKTRRKNENVGEAMMDERWFKRERLNEGMICLNKEVESIKEKKGRGESVSGEKNVKI